MEHKFEKAKKFFTEIKKTVYLWKNLWKEGTTALMRAPRTADKTAAALAIATEIAETGREVLYVNAEQRLDNCPAVDSDNLYVFTPEYESPEDKTDYADLVFEAIEQAVTTTSIRTFVIDSISRIAALSFGKNASVAYLMKRFVALQVKSKISILVLADDSTKTVNNALTALAASEIAEEPTPQQVGSRALATADNLSRKAAENAAVSYTHGRAHETSQEPEATAKEDDSQISKGFPAVATGRSNKSILSENRAPYIVLSPLALCSAKNCASETLTRRQRRALARRIAKGKIKAGC